MLFGVALVSFAPIFVSLRRVRAGYVFRRLGLAVSRVLLPRFGLELVRFAAGG